MLSVNVNPKNTIKVDESQDVNLSLGFNVTNPLLNLSLKQRGIKELRKIQAIAIQEGLFFRKGMLVFSPSGSGKTLIGELAAMNSVLEGCGKSIYLVPLKALAMEKYKYFVKYYSQIGLKIEISIGDYDMPVEDLVEADVAIMTYEKLDSMLRVLKDDLQGQFGTIVIDEIHIMGEEKRGPRLESLIMRLRRCLGDVQLIALSATISNPHQLNDWLIELDYDTKLLISKKRPVPLHHEIFVSSNVLRSLKEIIIRTLHEDGQVLVFAKSRRSAERNARQLSRIPDLLNQDIYHKRVALAFNIKQHNKFSNLPHLIMRGIAYHHAGLSHTERDVVEHAFRQGIISVICCTTTLSAGINLPARVVVLLSYKRRTIWNEKVINTQKYIRDSASGKYFEPIPKNTFHQIMGRAGRAGYDEIGKAYAFVHSKQEANWVENYYFKKSDDMLLPRYQPLKSMLGARDVMLEQLLVNVHNSRSLAFSEIRDFFEKSFYNHLLGSEFSLDTALKISQVRIKMLLTNCAVELSSMAGKFEINLYDVSNSRVSGAIESNSGERRYYEAQIIPGASNCTCGKENGLCIHLKFILKEVLLQYPEMEHCLNEMLMLTFKDECRVDYLLDNGFIKLDHQGFYSCSPYGSLVAKLYILPSVAVFIKQKIIEFLKKIDDPEESTLYLPWIFNLIREIGKKKGSSYKQILFLAMWHWIHEKSMKAVMNANEYPIPQLQENFDTKSDQTVYPGDFNNFKSDFKRWCRIIGKISTFMGLTAFSGRCNILEARVEFGINPELLEIVAGIKGVGRIRGRMLYDAGYKSIHDIQQAIPEEIFKVTGISTRNCELIIKSSRKPLVH